MTCPPALVLRGLCTNQLKDGGLRARQISSSCSFFNFFRFFIVDYFLGSSQTFTHATGTTQPPLRPPLPSPVFFCFFAFPPLFPALGRPASLPHNLPDVEKAGLVGYPSTCSRPSLVGRFSVCRPPERDLWRVRGPF